MEGSAASHSLVTVSATVRLCHASCSSGVQLHSRADPKLEVPRLLPARHWCSSSNLTHISPSLPPQSDFLQTADIVKWYGCELGALTKFDKTTGDSIVNGAHDTWKLKELLEKFIKTYVQASHMLSHLVCQSNSMPAPAVWALILLASPCW